MLREIPKFDTDLLPPALRPWCLDISDRMNSAIEYVAVGVLTSLATVIGRKVAIRPKRMDQWTVIANLWAAIIGRTGTMRTAALEEAKKPLNALVVAAMESYANAAEEFNKNLLIHQAVQEANKLALSKEAKQANPNPATMKELAGKITGTIETAKPTARRIRAKTTATIGKLGEVLSETPTASCLPRRADGLAPQPGQAGARVGPSVLPGSVERQWVIRHRSHWTRDGRYPFRLRQHSGRDSAGTTGRIHPIGHKWRRRRWPAVSVPACRIPQPRPADSGSLRPQPKQGRKEEEVYKLFAESLDRLDPSEIGANLDPYGDVPYLRFDDGPRISSMSGGRTWRPRN